MDAKNRYGLTPLHLASAGGHLKIVEFLMSLNKSDVQAKNAIGQTPLHFAAAKGHTEVIHFESHTFKSSKGDLLMFKYLLL